MSTQKIWLNEDLLIWFLEHDNEWVNTNDLTHLHGVPFGVQHQDEVRESVLFENRLTPPRLMQIFRPNNSNMSESMIISFMEIRLSEKGLAQARTDQRTKDDHNRRRKVQQEQEKREDDKKQKMQDRAALKATTWKYLKGVSVILGALAASFYIIGVFV